ncbi:MAG: hypothetical protein WKF59_24430 [Chitinophagaceae bacterium]
MNTIISMYLLDGWIALPTSVIREMNIKKLWKQAQMLYAAGGYTEVMLVPNTNPVVHNKSQIEYLIQRSKNLSVTVHPIGAHNKKHRWTRAKRNV